MKKKAKWSLCVSNNMFNKITWLHPFIRDTMILIIAIENDNYCPIQL